MEWLPRLVQPASPPLVNGAGNGMGFTDAVDGADAALTVDGIPVDSPSTRSAGSFRFNLDAFRRHFVGQTDTPVTLPDCSQSNPIGTGHQQLSSPRGIP